MIEYNNKSIEELSGISLGEDNYGSYVVGTATKAVKKPVGELSAEEIRLLIGQRIGVKYLLHRAVLILDKEPLIMTSVFMGDLMMELLRLETEEWSENELDHLLFKRVVSKHKLALLSALHPTELLDNYNCASLDLDTAFLNSIENNNAVLKNVNVSPENTTIEIETWNNLAFEIICSGICGLKSSNGIGQEIGDIKLTRESDFFLETIKKNYGVPDGVTASVKSLIICEAWENTPVLEVVAEKFEVNIKND